MGRNEEINVYGGDFPDQALVQQVADFAGAGVEAAILDDRMNEVVLLGKIDQTMSFGQAHGQWLLFEHMQTVHQSFSIRLGVGSGYGTIEKHLGTRLLDCRVQIVKQSDLQMEFRSSCSRKFKV